VGVEQGEAVLGPTPLIAGDVVVASPREGLEGPPPPPASTPSLATTPSPGSAAALNFLAYAATTSS